MRRPLVVLSVATILGSLQCGPSSQSKPKVAESDGARQETDADNDPPSAGKHQSETSSWSEVQSLDSSSSSSGSTKRKSQIVVSSDPQKHGDALHFRFLVNGVPISGVFVAPGGQTSTFTIPVGTVHFTVDECEWEAQGFELAPDEQMPIACKLTKEGDCCEVAIPVEEDKPDKSHKK